MAITFKDVQKPKAVHVKRASVFEKGARKIVVKSKGRSIFTFKGVQKPKDARVNWVSTLKKYG